MMNTSAHAFLSVLAAHGIDRIFQVPGESYIGLLDAATGLQMPAFSFHGLAQGLVANGQVARAADGRSGRHRHLRRRRGRQRQFGRRGLHRGRRGLEPAVLA